MHCVGSWAPLARKGYYGKLPYLHLPCSELSNPHVAVQVGFFPLFFLPYSEHEDFLPPFKGEELMESLFGAVLIRHEILYESVLQS